MNKPTTFQEAIDQVNAMTSDPEFHLHLDVRLDSEGDPEWAYRVKDVEVIVKDQVTAANVLTLFTVAQTSGLKTARDIRNGRVVFNEKAEEVVVRRTFRDALRRMGF